VPFDAVVLRVLIASPSDTVSARRALREALEDWNSVYAEHNKVMLLPVLWERDAVPEVGERPQAILNRQLVDVTDILIGLFWTRLGTPTGDAESGTVEEIDEFVKAGKPVLLYFSSESTSVENIDPSELARLNAFREEIQRIALTDTFTNEDELRRKVTAAVTRMVHEMHPTLVESEEGATEPVPISGPRARLLATVERDREIRGFSTSGRPQYTTRERLIVENRGDGAAENLTWSVEVAPGENEPFIGKDSDEPISRLPPAGTLEYAMATAFGTAARWDLVFQWTENGVEYEERQTMT
jgi:hypothetical protein